jgi:hypothetical protein
MRFLVQALLHRIKKLNYKLSLFWRELKATSACRALASLPSVEYNFGLPTPNIRLLVDGCFLNLGYFYRLQLFRSAVGSKSEEELGLVWRHNSGQCLRALNTLGIAKAQVYHPQPDPRCRREAQKICQGLRSAEDVLQIIFPREIPATFFYDYLLKRQRSASVNVADPAVEWHIWDFISSIYAAEWILEKHKPDMLAMSHSISLPYAPLSWMASRQGIPVVTPYG